MSAITIYTDGAARGNPGPASIAYVIKNGEAVIEFAEPIGETTNNQAEYRALRAALTRLVAEMPKARVVECFSDSELMVKQLLGQYRVKDQNLRPQFEAIQSLVTELERAGNAVEFTAIRREKNRRADELANMALDSKL